MLLSFRGMVPLVLMTLIPFVPVQQAIPTTTRHTDQDASRLRSPISASGVVHRDTGDETVVTTEVPTNETPPLQDSKINDKYAYDDIYAARFVEHKRFLCPQA